jgi:uncharacterized membrane protein
MSDQPRRDYDTHERIRFGARLVLSTIYLAAGILHVASPEKFLPIVPGWVPAPEFTVVATGVCEIAGALALLTTRLRKIAGVMLALYAVCVFPANVKHALEQIDLPGLPSSWWYHAPRLAFQPVLVWWALWCGEVIDWPFRTRQSDPT